MTKLLIMLVLLTALVVGAGSVVHAQTATPSPTPTASPTATPTASPVVPSGAPSTGRG